MEEGPVKKRHRRRSSSTSTASASTPEAPEEALEDEDEEDTTEEEEEEEEKFDIDDLSSAESSPQSTTAPDPMPQKQASSSQAGIGHEKAIEQERDNLRDRQRAEIAARAIAQGSPILRKGRRSRSRPGVESGIETPDRFPGPHPHPPKLSPRHVQFQAGSDMSMSSSTASVAHVFAPEMDRDATLRGERGARDDIHSPAGDEREPEPDTARQGHRV